MEGSRNLPNVITVGRIAACPAIFFMALSPSVGARLAAFVLFVGAGLSDLWTGIWREARLDYRRGQAARPAG